jgi:plastocyanin
MAQAEVGARGRPAGTNAVHGSSNVVGRPRKVRRATGVLAGEVIRQFRLLPAAVLAIATLATPVQAFVRHRPAHHPHKSHAGRHHAATHAQRHRIAHAHGQTPAVGRAGSALVALSPGARHQIAHAANATTVTIADFQFTPATITIHVGDTVTWVNHGPSAHTATTNNGSFNTGVLQKGHSASHTFTKAGTFTYICSIHPFMHGTVVVLANTASTKTTSTKTTPTTTTPTKTTPTTTTPTKTTPTTTTPSTTAGESTANILPVTGFAVTGTVLAGLLLTGAGLALRRKLRA